MSYASEEREAAQKRARRPWKIGFAIVAVIGALAILPAMSPKVPWTSPFVESATVK